MKALLRCARAELAYRWQFVVYRRGFCFAHDRRPWRGTHRHCCRDQRRYAKRLLRDLTPPEPPKDSRPPVEEDTAK